MKEKKTVVKTLKIDAETHKGLTMVLGSYMARTGESKTYDDAVNDLVSMWKRKEEKRIEIASQKGGLGVYQQEMLRYGREAERDNVELRKKAESGTIKTEDVFAFFSTLTHILTLINNYFSALQTYTSTLEYVVGD